GTVPLRIEGQSPSYPKKGTVPLRIEGQSPFLKRRREMANESGQDVVRLATAANPVQAHIWQQALEEEGIRSHVVGDYLDAGLGNITGVSPELWVHRDDLARAVAILRRGQEVSAEDEAEEAES